VTLEHAANAVYGLRPNINSESCMSESSPVEPSASTVTERVRKLTGALEIDRATLYALLLRVWQFSGGAVSAVLIASFFPREVQGFYYTFASLMALQAFFELGFNIVVINVSSHEWSRLRLDDAGEIQGDAQALSRLVSIGRLIFGWYGVASLLFVVGVGYGGALFLQQDPSGVPWRGSWMALVGLTGILLWTLPFNALLEGCNQVANVNRLRLIQAVLANVAIWSTVVIGGGLWAAVIATGMRVVCDLYFLCVRYRHFFKPFRDKPRGAVVHWQSELWPLQWRLAAQAVAGYFAFSIFAPVMFHYHGAVMAGRMGMTWVVISALQMGSMAWVQSRAPRFGVLVSRGEYQELDRLFRRLAWISLITITAGGGFIWLVVAMVYQLQLSFADRILGPLPTFLFVIASVLFHIPHCQDLYIRAHKQDRMLVVNVLGSGGIGLAVWLLGQHYGPLGAAGGYLAIVALVIFPGYQRIYWNCRRERLQSHLSSDGSSADVPRV